MVSFYPALRKVSNGTGGQRVLMISLTNSEIPKLGRPVAPSVKCLPVDAAASFPWRLFSLHAIHNPEPFSSPAEHTRTPPTSVQVMGSNSKSDSQLREESASLSTPPLLGLAPSLSLPGK